MGQDGNDRGQVERSTRLAGVLFLVGAVLTYYLADRLFSQAPAQIGLFELYDAGHPGPGTSRGHPDRHISLAVRS